MSVYSLSDIGNYRDKNQDSVYTCQNKQGDTLAIVCDGIGGGLAGEVASKMVCDYFADVFPNTNFKNYKDAEKFLSTSIKKANDVVYHKSVLDRDCFGMGTTLTGVLISGVGNIVFNVGDSRVYGFKNGILSLLTNDDTLVNKMLNDGEITIEEAENHPKKHYLIKAIGVFEKVEPTIKDVGSYSNFLVCSDGLHGYVSDDEILEILNQDKTIKEKCENLLSLALLKGGWDNISLVLTD